MKNKVAYFGLFVALALIFSYVETLIPVIIAVPGVKLGLTNLIVIVALYKMNFKSAALISITRILLSGFLFGNMASIMYSLAGGILSLIVMTALKRTNAFHLISISIAGGVAHNIGQLIVAMLVLKTYSLIYYFSVLMIAGLVTGAIIGIVANEMLKRLTNINMK